MNKDLQSAVEVVREWLQKRQWDVGEPSIETFEKVLSAVEELERIKKESDSLIKVIADMEAELQALRQKLWVSDYGEDIG